METKIRKSNFELLRIISMLMILSHHFAVHGVLNSLAKTQVNNIYKQGSLINKLFTCFLMPGGEIGVALFFMLTGYFLFKKQTTSILKVSVQTFFME